MTRSHGFSARDEKLVAPVLARLSSAAHHRISLLQLIRDCETFLRDVARGYRMTIEEYRNDYSARDLLVEIADDAPDELAHRLRRWIDDWDERFNEVTRPADHPVTAMSPGNAEPFRVPLTLVGDLREDLVDWGYLDPPS